MLRHRDSSVGLISGSAPGTWHSVKKKKKKHSYISPLQNNNDKKKKKACRSIKHQTGFKSVHHHYQIRVEHFIFKSLCSIRSHCLQLWTHAFAATHTKLSTAPASPTRRRCSHQKHKRACWIIHRSVLTPANLNWTSAVRQKRFSSVLQHCFSINSHVQYWLDELMC